MKKENPSAYFWQIAKNFTRLQNISRGSLMGFPCLRYQGEFFATADHRSGDLIVRLPATRVKELIAEGKGQAFAPAGKIFREWIQVSERNARYWKDLMQEAKDFARQKQK
jgi:hypothetical protein